MLRRIFEFRPRSNLAQFDLRQVRRGAGVEIEHAPQSSDDGKQSAQPRQANGGDEAIASAFVRDLETADGAVDRDRAAIAAVRNQFRAGNRPLGEEGENRIPIIGRAIAEPQRHQ